MRNSIKLTLAASAVALLAACGGGGGTSSQLSNQNNFQSNNNPIADAGSNQNAVIRSSVVLDGRKSKDADSDPLTYVWKIESMPNGSAAILLGSTTSQPTLTPDVTGDYVISLMVNDGKANSTLSSVTVTAIDNTPITLTSIEIVPEKSVLDFGGSQKLTVNAKYSNGTSKVVQDNLTWTTRTAACSFSDLDRNWTSYQWNTTLSYSPIFEYQSVKDSFISQRDLARNGNAQALNNLRSFAIELLMRSVTLYASSQAFQDDVQLVVEALDVKYAPELLKIENIVNNSCALGRWTQFVFELSVDTLVPFERYQRTLTEYQKVYSSAVNGNILSAWRYYEVAKKLNNTAAIMGTPYQLQVGSLFLNDTPIVTNYVRAASSVSVNVATGQITAVMKDNAKISVRYQNFNADLLIPVN